MIYTSLQEDVNRERERQRHILLYRKYSSTILFLSQQYSSSIIMIGRLLKNLLQIGLQKRLIFNSF